MKKNLLAQAILEKIFGTKQANQTGQEKFDIQFCVSSLLLPSFSFYKEEWALGYAPNPIWVSKLLLKYLLVFYDPKS